jgi:hypothetical protein
MTTPTIDDGWTDDEKTREMIGDDRMMITRDTVTGMFPIVVLVVPFTTHRVLYTGIDNIPLATPLNFYDFEIQDMPVVTILPLNSDYRPVSTVLIENEVK